MKTIKTFKEKTKKQLFIPISISGSGKSYYFRNTFSKQFPNVIANLSKIGATLQDIIVCPDDIRKELTGIISDQTKNPQVWALAASRTKDNLKNFGVSILDATNTDGKNRNAFISGLGTENIAIVFKPDIELSFERITNDINTGVDRSNVSKFVLKRQYTQFKNSVVGDINWDGEWNEKTKNKIREQLKTKFSVIKFVD